MKKPVSASLQVLSSLNEISAENWDQFANPETGCNLSKELINPYNPFLSHSFLYALEESGCAATQTGWMAQHLVLSRLEDGKSPEICGLVPCYLKNHSQGEYVFDHGWADAFERAGGHYYPKLQCSIPFTPVTGRRLLTKPDKYQDENRLLLADGIKQLCEKIEVSSAHLTFIEKDEYAALERRGFLRREDQQFHWQNNGYDKFEDFLQSLTSRKRKVIRKERRAALADNGVTIEWITGRDLTETIWDSFFEFYLDTGSRKWGRPYLNRKFYSLIGERMADDIVLIMAKRADRYIAGAINFIGSDTLYGRHWGCVEDHPFLHFEVCYYQAIDWAITHKKQKIEAGAQGEHKLARGYMPKITYSAHHIVNPGFRDAIDDYLIRERRAVERDNDILSQHGPFRNNSSP